MNIQDEKIVLLDNNFNAIGQALKLASHHAHTPLHLAFSCYIFNEQNQLLATQRAKIKKVWPGVWTNSLCGHPVPGESMEQAIMRRAEYELGISKLTDIECLIPDYRYTTPPMNGVIENEFCPVYVARLNSPFQPNPLEVEDYVWNDWDDYLKNLQTYPDNYSYWTKQVAVMLDRLPEFHDYLRPH